MQDDFHLAELDHDHTDRPGAILAALRGVHAIHREFDLARHGNDDQTESAAVLLADHRITLHREVIWLVAVNTARPLDAPSGRYGLRVLGADDELRADQVIGSLRVILPLLDNLENVHDIEISVRADWRRRGIGRVLASVAELIAVRRGRKTLLGYLDSDASDAPDALRPRDGEFSIAPSPATAFAQAMGYRLAQAERHSVQHLAGYPFVTPQVPAGYHLVSWLGPTPSEYLDHVADLLHAMSTDTPTSEVDFQEELWDAARVRAMDTNVAESSQLLTTLAIHAADQTAAGFTQLNRLHDKPAVVNQWNTLVAAAHRGHGLGLVLKQANLAELARHWPDAERVHTWNASENDYMWKINQTLGYRTANVDSAWQKRLGPSA